MFVFVNFWMLFMVFVLVVLFNYSLCMQCWGVVVGLFGQLVWLYFIYVMGEVGMFIVLVFFVVCYGCGVWFGFFCRSVCYV